MNTDLLHISLKYHEAKDITGKVIHSGDFCIPANVYRRITKEDGKVVFDFRKELKEINDGFRDCFTDWTLNITNNVMQRISAPNILLIEYFDIGEGEAFPFMYKYSCMRFNFWYDEWFDGNYAKIEDDLENAVIRYSKDIFSSETAKDKFLDKILCGKTDEIVEHGNVIDIPLRCTKEWKWLLKTRKGVLIHKKWCINCGKFPQIKLNINNKIVNRFEKKNLYTIKFGRFTEFYLKPVAERALEIVCEHPFKKHEETIYKFKGKSIQ